MSRGVMAIRIDDATRARIARAAERSGRSPSEAVRLAIDAWLEREESSQRPYDRVADLIGSVEGPGDLSTNAGKRFAAILQAGATKRRG